jgi:1-phosphofructokinase
MIVTVTLNPAIDKTAEVETFQHGALNRLKKTRSDAGGKGINVSKTIHALGGRTVAAGFLGEDNAALFRKCFADCGIRDEFLYVPGETRTNLKVMEADGTLTELNEPGFTISPELQEQLLARLEKLAGPDTIFVLSGSLPKGIEKTFYRTIIERVKAKGSRVLLDADGQVFASALEAGPMAIKPNDFELSQYFGITEQEAQQQRVALGRSLLNKGVQEICISCGASGSVWIDPAHVYESGIVKVEVHSTVGAGDAMVAAMAYALENRMNSRDAFTLAVAVSAGAVATEGTQPPELETVEALKKQVVLKEVSEGEKNI